MPILKAQFITHFGSVFFLKMEAPKHSIFVVKTDKENEHGDLLK